VDLPIVVEQGQGGLRDGTSGLVAHGRAGTSMPMRQLERRQGREDAHRPIPKKLETGKWMRRPSHSTICGRTTQSTTDTVDDINQAGPCHSSLLNELNQGAFVKRVNARVVF